MAEAKLHHVFVETFQDMNVPVFLQTAGGDIERDRRRRRRHRRRSSVASLFVTCQWEGQSGWLDRR